ncbi:FAD-dependent oxidoreductase [Bosea sp. TND4EK4]|uniref:FAD-dependent oxidoreductase n=1 Tax=Bosea sp. TND4EK4 TaxID=1907408 RepID=UPI0009540F8B|nr:FAD-dependent oxidoreductase [Bosea sp. TND4EK4]SIR29787.1 cyclic nucleotide-regulated FAD-dependent pyridine nucleotide-disulphide oxidoreductase [Bosea sp. TND4EK4]
MTASRDRTHQIFPTLTPAQIGTARRFADNAETRFAAGDMLYEIGAVDAPAWLVLEGTIEVVRRDGLSGEAIVTVHHPGQFSGEVNQLDGRPCIAGGRAGPQGCTAVPLDAAHLRALVIGSAELGEIIMRALILRRVDLIAEGGAGTILIGEPGSREITELQVFLNRAGLPNLVLDIRDHEEGRALVDRMGVLPEELPLVVCPAGPVLKRPNTRELAACLGLVPTLDPARLYDVAIVGAGPAGLAAAVYAASEGLSVLVLDGHATGGQAGASARIENYLGFPTGISGQALAGRALNQALKFGAEVAIPVQVQGLEAGSGGLRLACADNRQVRARAVVIASGAHYRRPDLPGLSEFEGAGISYWASAVEARLCAGEDVALIGGGNSAGQAIVYLAPQVRRLHVVVRRPLADTMSRYLIDRIDALSNVELHVGSEIASLEGDRATGLTAAVFRDRRDGSLHRRPLRHMFLFIGADPNAGGAGAGVEKDPKGFVLTGKGARSLETSLPGVFAIGDVRSGSTKRVAAAVGEGAAVVAQIHALFAEAIPTEPR